MIDYIHQRLIRWAEWESYGRRIVGIGFSPNPLLNFAGGSPSTVEKDPIFEEDSYNTALAITHLPTILKDVVIEHYQKPGMPEQKWRKLRLSKATFYRRLDHAHTRLASLIDDIESLKRSVDRSLNIK